MSDNATLRRLLREHAEAVSTEIAIIKEDAILRLFDAVQNEYAAQVAALQTALQAVNEDAERLASVLTDDGKLPKNAKRLSLVAHCARVGGHLMKPCPNPTCKSTDVHVGDRCGYVICRRCGLTGPVAPVGNDDLAELMWDSLPRDDDGPLVLARARIQYLQQTLQQVYTELHIGPTGDGMWRMRAMRLIRSALDGHHD